MIPEFNLPTHGQIRRARTRAARYANRPRAEVSIESLGDIFHAEVQIAKEEDLRATRFKPGILLYILDLAGSRLRALVNLASTSSDPAPIKVEQPKPDWSVLSEAQAAHSRLYFEVVPGKTPDSDIVGTVIDYLRSSAACNALLGSFPLRTTSPDRFLEGAQKYQQALDNGLGGISVFCRQRVEELKREGRKGNMHSLGHVITWEGITDAVVRYGQTLQ